MRNLIAALVLWASPSATWAENYQLEPIWTAMRMAEFVQLLSEEGLAEADGLEEALLGGNGGAQWDASLGAIYDVDRMTRGFRAALSDELDRRSIDGAATFFEGDLGARAIELELSARRELLDPDVEAASEVALQSMRDADDPRLGLIQRYSDANDLVEHNVAGAMNGNYMFLATLAGEGLGPFAEDPSSILAEIWSQEEEIRAETIDWVMSYFAMAYAPLSDADIEGLIAFSETPTGQRLNSALFSAFDRFFGVMARDLALESARFMKGEQL